MSQIEEPQEDEVEAEQAETKFAVIDDASMKDFDRLVPQENRAIVYPFEMDDF